MHIFIKATKEALGQSAANEAIQIIKKAVSAKGFASIIIATGASQTAMLKALVSTNEIDWSKIVVFHLDEYIDLSVTHPASFRKYLKERFVAKVDSLGSITLINGEGDPEEEVKRISEIITNHPIDVAMVGIGENGHLAFNDPPANFDTEQPYLVVDLDGPCRMQQFNEGWFKNFEDVPTQAISMSIRQIMKSKHIICSVPDQRKAQAVKDCLEKDVTNLHPASILQEHSNCSIYLDKESASLLENQTFSI